VLAEISQLLDLQTTDGTIHELSVQIERLHARESQTKEQIAEEQARVEQLRGHLAQLEHDSRMKNLAVDELDMNIRQYQERLEKGIISFKEMEDLRVKIESERHRISTMEDEALVLMSTIEDAREELARAIAESSTKVERLRSQIADIAGRALQAQEDTGRLQRERATLCDRIPAYLLKQYQALQAHSSEPVALVQNGTCAGCKLRLSGSTIERVRGGMAIVTCEHCSRILYIDDFSGDG